MCKRELLPNGVLRSALPGTIVLCSDEGIGTPTQGLSNGVSFLDRGSRGLEPMTPLSEGSYPLASFASCTATAAKTR